MLKETHNTSLPQIICDNLRQCQKDGYQLSKTRNKYGFFWDRGVGKTILELCIASNQIQYGKVLIITKEDLIYDNILQELDRLTKIGFPEFRFSVLLGTRKIISIKNKIFESHHIPDNYKPQIYLTSFSVFRDLWEEVCINIKTLIVDESGLLRNHWSKLSLAFRHAQDKFNFENIYLLSGLPAPNSEPEYFTQLYLIGQNLFGKSFEKYKEENFRIAKQNEPNAGKYVLKNPDEFKEKLKQVSQYISRHDIFKNIPEPILLKKYFTLTDEQRIYYDIVITQTKKYIREHSGFTIEILIPYIVKQIRWLQVICGLYVAEDGTRIRLKTNLYDTIWDSIEDTYEPILFWCNFDWEQANIVNYLVRKGKNVGFVHGNQSKEDQRIARQAFKDGKVQYLVLKPRSNAHGHNFQNVCSFAVYSTLTYSLDDKEQSFDRIFRPPYRKACTELCLIAKDTIQEPIYNAIQNKKNSALEVLNYLKTN